VTSGDTRKNYKFISTNFDADGSLRELRRSDGSGLRHGDSGHPCAGPGLPGQPVGNPTLVAGVAVGVRGVQHHQLPCRQHVELAVCEQKWVLTGGYLLGTSELSASGLQHVLNKGIHFTHQRACGQQI
jgi:hypothetical protein